MARPSETVLAIGLSRNTCLRARAAAQVVARCASFGVVLMIASISGSASMRLFGGLQPHSEFREHDRLAVAATGTYGGRSWPSIIRGFRRRRYGWLGN